MDHAYTLLDTLLIAELEAARNRLLALPLAPDDETTTEAEDPLVSLGDLADAACAEAQDRHEAQLLGEARAIAAGSVEVVATPEHLRALLAQLERLAPSAPRWSQQEPF